MNEPLAGRRLVSFTMSPKRFEVLKKHRVEVPQFCEWFDGVAVHVSEFLGDDRYIETYHDGSIRLVVEDGPTIYPDRVQEIRTYSKDYKPRPRHQRPLRNIKNRSV